MSKHIVNSLLEFAEEMESIGHECEFLEEAATEIMRLRVQVSDLEAERDQLRAELAEAKRDAERLLSQAADALERAPRWRDVVDELPTEAQEVLFVRGGKTVHGAWLGGIFWHNNQKMAASYWMPLPKAPCRGGSK